MPTRTVLLVGVSILAATSLTTASISQTNVPPSGFTVRLPPFLDQAINASNTSSHSSHPKSYVVPSTGFWTGAWYQTNSSKTNYRELQNLQWDLWPNAPTCLANTTDECAPGTLAGTLFDIITWAIDDTTGKPSNNPYDVGARGGGDRPVASYFSYDTPRRLNYPDLGPDWDGVYDLKVPNGPNKGLKESWSVIAWGLDAKRWPFMMAHETVGTLGSTPVYPQSMNLVTRNPAGMDHDTLEDVMKALIDLGNNELSDLVKELGPVNWDFELEGGPVICGKSCMANKSG